MADSWTNRYKADEDFCFTGETGWLTAEITDIRYPIVVRRSVHLFDRRMMAFVAPVHRAKNQLTSVHATEGVDGAGQWHTIRSSAWGAWERARSTR